MSASLSRLARAPSFEAFIEAAQPAIEAELQRIVRAIPEGFLKPFARYQMASGGKRMRPALALLAGVGFGAAPARVLPFAAACEFLHNFFLVHDDIEDGDVVRRDRPALWARFGLAHGVNAGDHLLALAVERVLSVPAPDAIRFRLLREFLFVLRRTILGQGLDIEHRGARRLSMSLWRRIVGCKTGDYLALALTGPAILAGKSPAAVEEARAAGRDLGIAFQAKDVWLDLSPGKGRGGEVGGDIREGKPSILAAFALSRLPAGSRARLRAILAKPREETGPSDVRWAAAAFERTGAMAFAERSARTLAARGLSRLARLRPSRLDLFEGFVRMIVERTR
ncbi:MAG: polyprenyl synthetase family protein [Planctomycetota bacterium]